MFKNFTLVNFSGVNLSKKIENRRFCEICGLNQCFQILLITYPMRTPM
jgi:hypothetical protein